MIIERGRNIPADGNKKTAIKKALDSAGIRDRDRPVIIGLLSHFDLAASAAPYRQRVAQSHTGYNSSRIRQNALELDVQASASDL